MINNTLIRIAFGALALGASLQSFSQKQNATINNSIEHRGKTENVIMVAMDGMRWQEIFGGVDSAIMNDKTFTKEQGDMKNVYWAPSPEERRKKLMPFFWETIATHGQLYGNRTTGNYMDVANPYKFTYPGFSETVTGNPDSVVNSNRLIPNKNINVLEVINEQKEFKGKVATFSTSVLFPYILNKWRNGLYVNANDDSLAFDSPQMQMLNKMEKLTAKPIGERPDLLTYFAAREYLISNHPRVLYIPLGETDEFAHLGLYDQYIGAVHAEDAMIADLWSIIQSTPQYKNKTTLIITCDHGRGGKIKEQWTDHGVKVEDSGSIWMAVMGPDSSPLGEVSTHTQIYQGQIAATIAALLGVHYAPPQKVLPSIESVLK